MTADRLRFHAVIRRARTSQEEGGPQLAERGGLPHSGGPTCRRGWPGGQVSDSITYLTVKNHLYGLKIIVLWETLFNETCFYCRKV